MGRWNTPRMLVTAPNSRSSCVSPLPGLCTTFNIFNILTHGKFPTNALMPWHLLLNLDVSCSIHRFNMPNLYRSRSVLLWAPPFSCVRTPHMSCTLAQWYPPNTVLAPMAAVVTLSLQAVASHNTMAPSEIFSVSLRFLAIFLLDANSMCSTLFSMPESSARSSSTYSLTTARPNSRAIHQIQKLLSACTLLTAYHLHCVLCLLQP